MVRAMIFLAPLLALAPALSDVTLDQLEPGKEIHGFTPTAVYLDDSDHPIGARFVHDKTGFTLDYLQIESAPQGFIWVTSFPTSDKGEPHTQEHLLLGKGDRGRRLGSFEAMELASSSAFTDQWRTCYHFHIEAGHEAFWPEFENQLGALLHPDYTDEEIRREVRNFGVDKADDGSLHLEEKGTVYNEMVRTYESPDAVMWRQAQRLIYGLAHPLSWESGGTPAGIRTMTPADIRSFHDAAYRLENMGMIGAFPSSMSLGDVLDGTAAVLGKEKAPPPAAHKAMTEAELPKPDPAPLGAVAVVPFPYSDETSPAPLTLAWPATRDLAESDRVLLELFLDAFAGDESTTLYKKLIDGKTRELDLGASGVSSWLSPDQGEPVYIMLAGVKASAENAKTVMAVRALVERELHALAALPPGDPALAAFDERVKSRVLDTRRRLAKFLDTPPGFGFRGTGPDWVNHLHELKKTSGFKKSLTLRPALDAVEAVLAAADKPGAANPWSERLKAWGLLAAPFGVGARPSPVRRAQLDAARDKRIADELQRLQKGFRTKDAATTLARYQEDVAQRTAAIEAASRAAPLPPLVDSAPMTFDDELKYATDPVAGLPALRATFDRMVSTRVSLAFRLDAVPERDLFTLAVIDAFMEQAGVLVDGKPIAADAMRERLRREVLELSVYETENAYTGRAELVVAGAGNDVAETHKALGWMGHVLLHPDWRAENLPRLRDVVDRQLNAARQRMLGPEETWVTGPRDAWWKQTSPLHLHVGSFLTQVHDLLRVKWMLAATGDAAADKKLARALDGLAPLGATLSRAQLTALSSQLAGDAHDAGTQAAAAAVVAAAASDAAKGVVRAAGKDLAAFLPDLPDGSLAADWASLCKEMAAGVRAGPAAALEQLEAVRKKIVTTGNARIVEVGSSAHQAAVAGDVAALVKQLARGKPARQRYVDKRGIVERMKDHDKDAAAAVFVGLVDPATSSGVFLNAAPAPDYSARKDDDLLDYLAAVTYSGHGAHSMFMKTWAAGLAYSNGLHPQPWDGRVEYYAERCPLLPQTLRFVISQIKAAGVDDNIARYAVAGAFSSRVAQAYEARASAMAANLVDGVTPDVIRGFREKIKALAKRKDLADDLAARMPRVYGAVLPGLGRPVKDGVYFVIGPEPQLKAYEDYLHGALGKDVVLHRLYPRDFWVP